MRTISIFVASSIVEFERERIYIGDFIRRLNDKFKPLGNRVRLHMCEDEYINSQSFYDRLIESSDIFILMIGRNLGEFSKHELVDIADKSPYIKKKVIILKDKESASLIPTELKSYYDIKFADNKDEIQTLISDLIEDVILDKADEFVPTIDEDFILSIPSSDDIEVAVLNNIIRRLNDQDVNIVVHEESYDGSENACVGLLTKSLSSEKNRLLSILSKITTPEELWIFADEYYSYPNILQEENCVINDLNQVLKNLINNFRNYPTYYSNIKNLATDFEIRLRRALHTIKITEKVAERSAFIYIVEDHWLIQKSLISGRKTLRYNLWDITLNCSREKALRKERVIVNLLNIYWLSGQWNKHVDAWTKLSQKKYDELLYSADELGEIKAKNLGQASYDYICDNLERIQTHSYHGKEWLNDELISLINFIESSSILTDEQIASSHILVADAYSEFNDYIDESINHYEIALSIEGIEINALVRARLATLIRLSKELIETGKLDKLNRISLIGLRITDISDIYHWSIFKMLECISLYQYPEQQRDVFQELMSILKPDTISKDNSISELYINLMILFVQVEVQKQNDISIYKNLIDGLIFDIKKYLIYDESRTYLLSVALSLKSLIDNDVQLSHSAVALFKDKYPNVKTGKFYCDLLFNNAYLSLKNGLNIEAIPLFDNLTSRYLTSYDRASSYQNLAICYMHLYKDPQNLIIAERNYHTALKIFKDLDVKMVGNIHDGLSYCFLLQNKYDKAEQEALAAIEIQEYKDENKYCNYISSLICQNKFKKAISTFRDLNHPADVLRLLDIDWTSEIKSVGINTTSYRWFRIICKFYLFSRFMSKKEK